MKHILTWIAHESTTDHVSLVISVLAFAVALWAGYQTKRSASATEKQARVALEQLQQSEMASYSAEKAAKEAKAVTWHDINDRIMERAARVVIGVEDIKRPPILLEEIPEDEMYPRAADPNQPKTLNVKSLRERYSHLFYWVRGVIINDDTRSIQLIPFRVKLVEGTTYLIDGKINVPPKMNPVEGRFLLAPGKAALFESRIDLTVKEWIEIYKESETAPTLRAGILAYPAGDPETSSYTSIEFEGCPLMNNGASDEIWEIAEYEPMYAQVKPPRLVRPKALRQLMLAMDESGTARDDPRISWDLDPWQRDLLDLW